MYNFLDFSTRLSKIPLKYISNGRGEKMDTNASIINA
jgi:hypothetical protein